LEKIKKIVIYRIENFLYHVLSRKGKQKVKHIKQQFAICLKIRKATRLCSSSRFV